MVKLFNPIIKKTIFRSIACLTIAFALFIFRSYYQPIFAIRIFCVHAIGLVILSIIISKVIRSKKRSNWNSTIAITYYFSLYFFCNRCFDFYMHGRLSRMDQTGLVEFATFIYTVFISIIINLIFKTKNITQMPHLIFHLVKAIIFLLFKNDKQQSKAQYEIPISQLLYMLRSEVMSLKIRNNNEQEWKNQIVVVAKIQNKIETRLNLNSVKQKELKRLMNDLINYLKFGNPDWKYVKQTLSKTEAIGDILS